MPHFFSKKVKGIAQMGNPFALMGNRFDKKVTIIDQEVNPTVPAGRQVDQLIYRFAQADTIFAKVGNRFDKAVNLIDQVVNGQRVTIHHLLPKGWIPTNPQGQTHSANYFKVNSFYCLRKEFALAVSFGNPTTFLLRKLKTCLDN
ncbi:MAG: hypothetical protein HY063_05260 [Bacteroidetes bacterium]|nr:hypothetical protein [Bacteroidota bacterium]